MNLRALPLLLLAFRAFAQDATLTTAREVLALQEGEAERKPAVRLRGVVTYFKGAGIPDLVVQDATGGVFVSGAEGKVPAGLHAGSVVEIEGVCNPRGNSFTPRVEMESARILGEAPLPVPVAAGMDDLRSGRLDCERVEVRAIVRAARLDEALTPPRLILKIATSAGECDAWVLAFAPGDGARLVDAAVRVRGVCLGWQNPRRQLTAIRLLVGSVNDLTIERPAPPDAFAAPLVAPDALLRYQPGGGGHRVRVRGIVTLNTPGELLVLQSGTLGLRARPAAPVAVNVGDEIEAAGFPELLGYSGGLTGTLVRVLAHPGPPEPLEKTPLDLLDSQPQNDGDQQLVRVRATLRGIQRGHADALLLLTAEGLDFPAHVPISAAVVLPEPGALLVLTGICEIQPSQRVRLVGGSADGFALRLRGAEDIAVLRPASWLNAARLRWILGGLAGVLAFAVAWVFALRRRVKRRTAQLAREIRARHDVEIEHAAVAGERSRLAAELHDSLQQNLTSAALQLDAATLDSDADAAALRERIITARTLLEVTREDLRVSLHDLRATTPAPDLIAELQAATDAMRTPIGPGIVFKTSGEPRPLPAALANHALRIAQEALTNAIHHARARCINVLADFSTARFSLRIEDDGCGFTPASVGGNGHFGLANMRDRATRCAAALAIESTPGTGTSITFTTTEL